MSSAKPEDDRYVFITRLDDAGKMTRLDNSDGTWEVSTARPVEGSLTERVKEDVVTTNDVSVAVQVLFSRMYKGGLPAVLDSPDLRVHNQVSPVAFVDSMNDAINSEIEQIPEGDQRDDDFDNTQFSELRDMMVDWCQEYDPDASYPDEDNLVIDDVPAFGG